jgi:predicted MPP superfamily phosphohydrolase
MGKKLIASAMLGGTAAALGYGWYQNNVAEITHRRIFANIEKPLKMLCLSDLHGKQFGAQNSKLIAKAAELSPDLIVFPGDTISSDCKNLGSTVTTLKKLSAIAPCFLIPGNHEHRSGRWEKTAAQLREAGITVLQNEIWSGVISDVSVNILGLDEGIELVKRTP